jgi:hypothetical protein
VLWTRTDTHRFHRGIATRPLVGRSVGDDQLPPRPQDVSAKRLFDRILAWCVFRESVDALPERAPIVDDRRERKRRIDQDRRQTRQIVERLFVWSIQEPATRHGLETQRIGNLVV